MKVAQFPVVAALLVGIAGCNNSDEKQVVATKSSTAKLADAVDILPAEVTYSRDIAPILVQRCAKCHRAGEAAPFSLLSYDEARERATQIRDVTTKRFMPPWLPEAGHAAFQNERRLSDAEVELIARWVDGGALAGDATETPVTPTFTTGWQLGQPDVVLESPEFQLTADGPDRFRNFVLDTNLKESRWVRAVELRPLNARVTHHARLGIDADRESERRDAADPAPGYEGMAWGQDPKGQLITWTPGMLPDEGMSGTAWKLLPDSKLVLHTHLQPSGKAEMVRFRVGLYFADGPPTVQPMILRIGSRDVDIPPGEANHVISDVYTPPIDVFLQSIFPHAHKLCREIVVEAVAPSGSAQTLVAIRNFDEKWHDKYRLVQPLRLPRGTQLRTRFVYDNSAANVRNPNHPPARVVYGSNANDEMSDVFLQVIPADPDQYAVLEEHASRAELRSKIAGYQLTLQMHPADNWSWEGLAACYVANHEPLKTIGLHRTQRQVLESSPQACGIVGLAYLATGDGAKAELLLKKSLTKDDSMPVTWLGLGQTYAAAKKQRPAEQALRRAIDLSPRMIVARLDLVDLLISQERLDEALKVAEAAVAISPDEHLPLMKLAEVYARQKKYDESLADFSAARKLAPFVYSPRCSLGIACYQQGDEVFAGKLFRQATVADAGDPVPHCFLGQIARRNGATAAARSELQRALDLPIPPSWPESHARQFLKLVYTEQLQLAQQLEDKPLARQALQHWTQLEPENASVKQLLDAIERD